MDFDGALRDPHNLSPARIEAFCRYVELEIEQQSIGCEQVSGIIRVRGENNLAPLDCFADRIGVYAFQRHGRVIYVGAGGAEKRKPESDWSLRDRIPQHLTENNAGGTLRINWERRHGCDFEEFQAQMAECCLWIVSFQRDEDKQKILRLEHLLIGLLGPEYCDVPESNAQNNVPD